MDSDGAQRHVRPTKLEACTVGKVKPQLMLSANDRAAARGPFDACVAVGGF